jgi:hypothetical protein
VRTDGSYSAKPIEFVDLELGDLGITTRESRSLQPKLKTP